jgi:hypothetical protein
MMQIAFFYLYHACVLIAVFCAGYLCASLSAKSRWCDAGRRWDRMEASAERGTAEIVPFAHVDRRV